MTNNTDKQFQATTCGPRQFSKVKKALGKLTWERGSFVEVRGTEGQPDTYTRTHMTVMFGTDVRNPRADELLQEVGERFGWEVTKANANELSKALEAAAKEAHEAAPEVFELRKPEAIKAQAEEATKREEESDAKQTEARTAWQAILDQRPPNATALIVAQLDEDDSDTMTDYFAHKTVRQVAIGWRTGQRESFKQLRKAAGMFEPTSGMGPGCDIHTIEAHRDPEDTSWRRGELLREDSGPLQVFTTEDAAREFMAERFKTEPEAQPDYVGACGFWYFASRHGFEVCCDDVEHRDNYSMGAGNYLKRSSNNSSGWRVLSVAIPSDFDCHLSYVIEDGLHKATPSDSSEVQGKGYSITARENKRAPFHLVELTDKVERAEFETLRDSAKAAGGWYSRKWGKCPGGFGFPTIEEAQAWARKNLEPKPTEDCTEVHACTPGKSRFKRHAAGVCDCKARGLPDAPELYDEAEAAGLVIGNHESDLYLKYTPEARDLCEKHNQSYTTFRDMRDGGTALDCPFAYAPFWRAKAPKVKAKPKPEDVSTNPAHNAREREAQRLDGLADTMQKDIDHKRAPLTQNPTPRRLAIKEGQCADADRLEKAQEGLRALAAALRTNSLPPILAGVSSRKAVDEALHNWADSGPYLKKRKALQELVKAQGLSGDTRREERKAEQEKANELDSMRWQKIPGFYPTPPAAAARLVELLEVEPGHTVLEPSAGTGSLVQALLEDCDSIQRIAAVEHMPTLSQYLEAKFSDKPEVFVYGTDFEDFAPHAEGYDRIAMNPPFEKGAGFRHVLHAVKMLKKGGRLVAILPPNQVGKAMNSPALIDCEMWSEPLPEGSFNGPDAFKRTGVSVELLVIERS